MNDQTAIILFSRTPKEEAKLKPLCKDYKSSVKVASIAMSQALNSALKSGLPVYVFTENEQRGVNFGERIANAIDDIFIKGYERVIAIGNDCLSLGTREILSAVQLLVSNDCVLGEAEDGGVYLIGLHRLTFQKNTFQNIRWQTNLVLSDLINLIDAQSLTLKLLSKKPDLDRYSDWKHVLSSLELSLRKKLLTLISLVKYRPKIFNDLPINFHFLIISPILRAPPNKLLQTFL
ncbi:MAG: DUF2064 domain-containing protein [Saprospiraceae bacterium]